MDKKQGARNDLTFPDNAEKSDYTKTLESAGITTQQSSKCNELLDDMDKAKGNQYVNSAKSNGATKQTKTLKEMGISFIYKFLT